MKGLSVKMTLFWLANRCVQPCIREVHSYFTATTQVKKEGEIFLQTIFVLNFNIDVLGKKGRNEINKIEFNIYQGKVVASL